MAPSNRVWKSLIALVVTMTSMVIVLETLAPTMPLPATDFSSNDVMALADRMVCGELQLQPANWSQIVVEMAPSGSKLLAASAGSKETAHFLIYPDGRIERSIVWRYQNQAYDKSPGPVIVWLYPTAGYPPISAVQWFSLRALTGSLNDHLGEFDGGLHIQLEEGISGWAQLEPITQTSSSS